MTLEQLLQCDAATLKGMSDKELLEYFKPYLNVTRPELAEKPARKSPTTAVKEYKPTVQLTPQKQRALELLAASGDVDMSFLKRQMKRK